MDWGQLYGLIITVTGWTWETVDNLSLTMVDELTGYWADNPPVHLLVKAFLGVESKEKTEENVPGEEELKSIAAAFR